MSHVPKRQKIDAPPLDDHLGFVDAILKIMAQSAKASGSRSTDVIAEEIAKRDRSRHDRVAKSRFLLGADDGSYLRQAVMPLQTSEPGIQCDDLSIGPSSSSVSNIQESGRRAVLETIQTEITGQLESELSKLKCDLDMASYLLTIQEVCEFVKSTLTDKSDALKLVTDFEGDVVKARKNLMDVDLNNEKGMKVRCDVLLAVALIFERPKNLLEDQLDLSIYGKKEMKMGEQIYAQCSFSDLYDAINRIAIAGGRSRVAYILETALDNLDAEMYSENVGDSPVSMNAIHNAVVSAINSSNKFQKSGDGTDIGMNFEPRETHLNLGLPLDMINPFGPSPPPEPETVLGPVFTMERLFVLMAVILFLYANSYISKARRNRRRLTIAQSESTSDGPSNSNQTTAIVASGSTGNGSRQVATVSGFLPEISLLLTGRNGNTVFDALNSFFQRDLQSFNVFINGLNLGIAELDRSTSNAIQSLGGSNGLIPSNVTAGRLTFVLSNDSTSNSTPVVIPSTAPNVSPAPAQPRGPAPGPSPSPSISPSPAQLQGPDPNPSPSPSISPSPAQPQGPAPNSSQTPSINPSKTPSPGIPMEMPSGVNKLDLILAGFRDTTDFYYLPTNVADTESVSLCSNLLGEIPKDIINKMYAQHGDYSNMDERQVAKSFEMESLLIATSRLREDYGTNKVDTSSGTPTISRKPMVSPFWEFERTRTFPRTLGVEDEWTERIWKGITNSGSSELKSISKIPDALQRDVDAKKQVADADFMNDKNMMNLGYCTTRGLCASRAPHHASKDGVDDGLNYTFPRARFPTCEKPREFPNATQEETVESKLKLGDHDIDKIELSNDLLERPADMDDSNVYIEPQKTATWVPVELSNGKTAGNKYCKIKTRTADKNISDEVHVASCVVYETCMKLFRARANDAKAKDDAKSENTFLGAIAAAKLKQMQSMSHVFANRDSNEKLADLTPPYLVDDKNKTMYKFVTRPVALCQYNDVAGGHSVLYPCDAGLACFMSDSLDSIPLKDAKIESTDPMITGSDKTRLRKHSVKMTPFLHRLLRLEADNGRIPIYVANPPELDDMNSSEYERLLSGRDETTFEIRKPKHSNLLPPKGVDFFRLARNCIRSGLNRCDNILKLKSKKTHVDSFINDGTSPNGPPDAMARARRTIIWNDALREACVSGDRLFAFVRQLSGVINEQVDAVCVIDENLLIQQQNKMRERRSRISERAAQEHIQLVKSVFTAVMKDSGLVLGIEKGKGIGDIANLKVVSNTLRKQVSELAQGQGQEGFFGNSVRMEQLLANGTGEITLQELFNRLQDVGKALQNSVAMSTDEDPSFNSSTMDFLSAPRNSMMLRYKPEALAAIKQAFEIFQREFATRYGVMQTPISAFELMEGNDDSLTTYFATFCGHMMVHSRMFGSNTAMYIGMWPAAANANALKISLERLCRAAFAYRSTSSRPNFLQEDGREKYFERAASRDTRLFFASAPSGPGWDRKLERPYERGYLS